MKLNRKLNKKLALVLLLTAITIMSNVGQSSAIVANRKIEPAKISAKGGPDSTWGQISDIENRMVELNLLVNSSEYGNEYYKDEVDELIDTLASYNQAL